MVYNTEKESYIPDRHPSYVRAVESHWGRTCDRDHWKTKAYAFFKQPLSCRIVPVKVQSTVFVTVEGGDEWTNSCLQAPKTPQNCIQDNCKRVP
ncbi:hypothetical protein AWC38_SpisGene17624 [Stylophora pistillata]|uniref:Uncharacterized protein n=1 Tax=Stylophora pistillata TaxID=50429 RepID=A0A2B4RK86_STYPI|nr:hypothetical protein AWC38_SpisGene17624 [Stylophora pistillata]